MEDKSKDPGLVWVPYIMETKDPEPDKESEYDLFMKEYHKKHEVCPKCGSLSHTTTLVGYILNWEHKEKYMDKNRCTCLSCGDVHICHDRVERITWEKVK